jgi:hypothetical protein
MKTNSPKQAGLMKNSTIVAIVTRKVVRERAVELAMISGRSAQEVSKSDLQQAKRDLAVEPAPKGGERESAAAREHWDPAPGSSGYKVHVPSGDEEDDEGRSDTERLVERGVKDAGREQAIEAAKEAEENE